MWISSTRVPTGYFSRSCFNCHSLSINLLLDVDPRLFGKMSEEEKDDLKAELLELERIVSSFKKQLEK